MNKQESVTKFEVWDLKDNIERYKLLLAQCNKISPYHECGYLLAEENAENYPVKVFVSIKGNEFALITGVIRCINDLSYMPKLDDIYYDFITPHEYAAIISNSDEIDMQIELLLQMNHYFQCNNVVFQFHRLNPYYEQLQNIYKSAGYEVVHSNYQVYVDLVQTIEELQKQYKPSVRRNIRRAEKELLSFEIAEKSEENVKCFMIIYQKAMEILEAKKFLYFNYDYFIKLVKCEDSRLVFVRNKQGKVIAASVLLLDKKREIAYYHLGCFDRDYTLERPMNYLIHSIVMWCKNQGFKKFHLAGGRENLHRFKAGYSEKRVNYYIASKRNLPDQYEEICCRWERKFMDLKGESFYPLYRYNEE